MAKQLRALDGKVVAITGGARGIGRATAAALIAHGARVAIGDLDAELTGQVAGELGGGTIGLQLDVRSRASFTAFLDETERRLGPLDVLVNNAGIMAIGEYAQEPDAVTHAVLDVNLGGTMLGCKLALARLLPRDTGHIVNVSSGLGRTAVPNGATYSATKYAVVGLSEALRAELAGTGVELHIIYPNVVATDMAAGMKRMRGLRPVRPEAVAQAIVDALRSGRIDTYVPRALGVLVAIQPIAPGWLVTAIKRVLGSDHLLTHANALERAAYEARIATDPATSVANAAASVADAVRAQDAQRSG